MPTENCSLPYLLITVLLTDHIHRRSKKYGYDIIADQMQNKATTSRQNKEKSIKDADELYNLLPDQLQRAIDLAKEKGASTWLTVLPLKEHSFSLHTSAFHDALALRYGWTPSKQPLKCECADIMRFVTSLPIYSRRSATTCALNPSYSQCLPITYLVHQQTHRIVRGSPTVYGEGDTRRRSST